MSECTPPPIAEVRARHVAGFDDPACNPDVWQRLLSHGDTDVVFLTREWLEAWWTTVGQGDLLLVTAERNGEVLALAPLFALEGMVFFLGAGESDYLDFIGDVHDPDVLCALLTVARESTPGFVGFKFHLVPDRSQTGSVLKVAAERIGLTWYEEAELPAVEIALSESSAAAVAAVNGSMRDREHYLRRRGDLEIHRLSDAGVIREQLPAFYAQHVGRWEAKGLSSQFCDDGQRAFLERYLELASPAGTIRFMRIDWQGRPIAFEFAWYYRRAHYSGPWCFAVERADRSPGQVLLRQSLLAAVADGIQVYDLGTGDQSYKLRLPVRMQQCRTWGLYPP